MLRRFSYFCALRPPWPPLTGYLANWKMLEPRKLMPPSIEDWSAPIAVITEMTENTPIVMPTIVRPERSLFAPNDCIAMEMISRKRIRQRWSDGVVDFRSTHYSITPFLLFIPERCDRIEARRR